MNLPVDLHALDDLGDPHAPGKGGLRAVGFHIDEIAPAAYRLPNEKTKHAESAKARKGMCRTRQKTRRVRAAAMTPP